jgi:hypothetical protein
MPLIGRAVMPMSDVAGSFDSATYVTWTSTMLQ